jgi:opacity protein-like surface antigen
MKLLFIFLLAVAPGLAQRFSWGVKAGVPVTDLVNATSSQNFTFNANTNRYIIGGTAELHLLLGFSVEVDALYRHLNYAGAGGTTGVTTVLTSSTTSSGAWEFPILAKYRFPFPIVRPYVDAGVAFDSLSGLSQTVTRVVAGSTTTTSTSNPPELNQSSTRGFVMGGGIDIHVIKVHVSPELRYTRWGAQNFLDPNGLLHSNQNQAEFLVGVTF